MPYATLPHRFVLRLHGEDTLAFLQGLVTNNVLLLEQKPALYTAMLTPQGKFLHDFFLIAHAGDVWLECDRARAAELQQRLVRYRLRSRVAIEPLESCAVAVLWDMAVAAPLAGMACFADPRLAALGHRAVGEARQLQAWLAGLPQAGADDYDAHRIRLGIPEGGADMLPEQSFPLGFGLEALHGVDFTKGCYVGQEVTARSKHLARQKKRLYLVQSKEGALPPSGTALTQGGLAVGELGSVRERLGLALLSMEAVDKAQQDGAQLECGGMPVSVQVPGWIKSS
jgi:folate-binding protein YgfZ